MATVSKVLGRPNPMNQMKHVSGGMETGRFGDPVAGPDVAFSPQQRQVNQMKTSSQVLNYAASKQMSEQSRTDMRGSIVGYSETLG